VGSRWKRIAVPVVGIFAVMAALALVAGAPIVLFPDEGRLDAAPPPAAGSSEVTQVTTPPPGQPASGDSSSPAEPTGSNPLETPLTGSGSPGGIESGPDSPIDGQPISPRRPAGEDPSDGGGEEQPADGGDGEAKGKKDKKDKKDKPDRKGKAKGHDKSKAQGNANGHDKWHGSSQAKPEKSKDGPVAFDPPRGQKPDHVDHSRAGKHAGRGNRPHARPRR
jgi:hypothetical protein